jgi:hypothetical protein
MYRLQGLDKLVSLAIKQALAQQAILRRGPRRLLVVIGIFLVVTLVFILAPAIMGLISAKALLIWRGTLYLRIVAAAWFGTRTCLCCVSGGPATRLIPRFRPGAGHRTRHAVSGRDDALHDLRRADP